MVTWLTIILFAGTVILQITTDYNNLSFTFSDGDRFVTIDNGSIVVKDDILLDGPRNTAACAQSQKEQPSVDFYCFNEMNNKKTVRFLFNFTNDYGPEFTAFETSVNESLPVGSTVLDLSTIVLDHDCTTSFNFFIDDLSRQRFQLVPPRLVLLQSLDYEVETEHLINVTATSSIQNGQGSQANTTTLTIDVLDVDDMSPVFDISKFLLRVPEGQSQDCRSGLMICNIATILPLEPKHFGFAEAARRVIEATPVDAKSASLMDVSSTWFYTTPQILARDGDVGINVTLVYSIHSVTPNLNMEINNKTGQVKVLEQLDRENIPAYTVVVKATQIDVAYKTATATLSLLVDDVNDNRPVFTPQPNVAIVENAPDGSYVMKLSGEDQDEGDNALFDFIITNDSIGAFKTEFQPTTNKSILVVGNSTALRGQVQAVVQFYLKERRPIVGPACTNTTTCFGRVTIDIIDVNLNTPEFSSSSYTFMLPSNTSGHYVIGQVFAHDEDRGENAVVKYSFTLVAGPPDCSNVTLNLTNGVLATDRQLPPGATCSWIITGCDSPTDSNTRRCSSVPASLAVIFSGAATERNVSVPENVPVGTVVTILPITGLHTTSTEFEITDTLLFTKLGLDREVQDFYQVPVLPTQSLNSSVMIINIRVTDVNDNTPNFTNPSYSFTIASNHSSRVQLLRNPWASVPGATEFVFRDSLARRPAAPWRETELYGLNSSVMIINIRVTDVNDNTPNFTNPSYIFTIASNHSSRVQLLRNPWASVPGATEFVFRDSLARRPAAPWRETELYGLNSSVMIINIRVTDVNDNTPNFTNPSYIFTIASNHSSNSTVGQVQASDIDSDENADVVYSLTSSLGPAECSGIQLHPKTGELWMDKPLTAGVVCPLIATACDSPTDVTLRRCSSVPVSVSVMLSWGLVEYNVTVLENVPVGTLVFVLPNNGLDTTSTDFMVKDNALVTQVDIDRESKDFYSVSVVPRQSTNSTIIIINIEVADVNDNTPEFTSQHYTFSIASNTSSNLTVGIVAATDLDIGGNGQVRYNLTTFSGPDECSKLTLGPTTGHLISNQELPAGVSCSWIVMACDSPVVMSSRRCSSVPLVVVVIPSGNIMENTVTIPENVPIGTMVKPLPIKGLQTTSTEFEIRADVLYTRVLLDRELKDSYEVSITSPQNASSVVMIVYVNVSDVNDNAPVFGQSVYVINMDSSWKINQTVLQVNATDADIGINAQLTFSLATGREYFHIDPTTGQVRLTNFPTVRDSEYHLLVTDSGQPSLSSMATLKVYNPVYNETATVLLPVRRDELLADREGVARILGSILGVTVKIYNIESLGPAADVGSKVYISATSAQGQPISPTELNKLLEMHAVEIYEKFAKSKPPSGGEDSDGMGLSVVEIVLICLACVLLLLLLLAAFLWYRSHKKLRQSRRLFDSLNKDTTIYDNPRKPSSSAIVAPSNSTTAASASSINNNNSTNAHRMMARLSSGSVGNSSVTNLLSAQGDGNSEGSTPPGSSGSQRRQAHDYQNVLISPLSNDIIRDDTIEDTSPEATRQEQITTFSSQITDDDITNTSYPYINTMDTTSTQQDYTPSQTWPEDNTPFSGRRNSDVDSGTISDKDNQLEDEDDKEVAEILSEPNLLTHSHEDTVDSPINRSNLDLMTTSNQLEDAHPGETDNPAYLDTETPYNIPPEPEPDYAKKVRFSDTTAQVDTSESIDKPNGEDKDLSLAKFLNQYGGAENLATDADTTQDSLEEMTAL